MPTTLTEGKHRGEHLVSEASGHRSRALITIANGEDLKAGHVIGRTVDGASITTQADAGNTGDGAITMEATAVGAGVVSGDYVASCIEPATDGGIFAVQGPDGINVGTAVVGSTFDGPVRFTINDGATDFAAGDRFTITVPDGDWAEYDPTNTDGSDTPRGILYDNVDATGGAEEAVAHVRDAEVNKAELAWFDGATDDQKSTALKELAKLGIIGR
ncbi:head decoration protein [Ferruginivarius sediminum]|uniref:Head decoration protein n=1 Tax=Ferruginivarius sediminum TaxID=2661937 RepID=A0A369TET4_9PROT|nr:head decoration protein [Ferruginivarius sediminum]RDD63823.1 head decoration protein [Ferruginivarius sediminum]